MSTNLAKVAEQDVVENKLATRRLFNRKGVFYPCRMPADPEELHLLALALKTSIIDFESELDSGRLHFRMAARSLVDVLDVESRLALQQIEDEWILAGEAQSSADRTETEAETVPREDSIEIQELRAEAMRHVDDLKKKLGDFEPVRLAFEDMTVGVGEHGRFVKQSFSEKVEDARDKLQQLLDVPGRLADEDSKVVEEYVDEVGGSLPNLVDALYEVRNVAFGAVRALESSKGSDAPTSIVEEHIPVVTSNGFISTNVPTGWTL